MKACTCWGTKVTLVEFCQSGFKGGTHIKFEQKYMREHIVHCLEKGNFSAFPKNHVEFAPENIKINTYTIKLRFSP
jgi:hypothetical protein